MSRAVIIQITRGGKDPDEYYHVVSGETANVLNRYDPLVNLDESAILKGFLNTEAEAREWCNSCGWEADELLIYAEGY